MITDRKDAVPVTTVKRRLVRIGNKIGVWIFRWRFSSRSKVRFGKLPQID